MPRFIKNRFEYATVRVIDLLLSLLRWETAQEAGAFVGGMLTRVLRKRWSMTQRNVSLAFPDKSPHECRAIAMGAWRNTGRLMAEFFRSRHLSKEEVLDIVRFENPELCESLLAEGKGLIINVGHMGNWEVGGMGTTARGLPLVVLGRAMKNPYLDRFMIETRAHFGAEIMGHKNPFFQLVRWLKAGKMTVILIDHNIPQGGFFVPFFGRPAATSTLSGLLAAKLGVPILSGYSRREGRNIIVRFDGPIRPDPKANPEKEAERLTVEMVKVLEGYVREYPEQWLWGHNRWKRSHKAPAAEGMVKHS